MKLTLTATFTVKEHEPDPNGPVGLKGKLLALDDGGNVLCSADTMDALADELEEMVHDGGNLLTDDFGIEVTR